MLALLDKFNDTELENISLFLSLRKNKKIKIDDEKSIIVYEALVKHIVALENNNIDIPTLIYENTNLSKDEIDFLPFNLYLELRDNIINFDNEKENTKENTTKKK